MKPSFWSILFLGFFLLFALPAFAQDEYVEADGSYEAADNEEPVYEEHHTQQTVNANTAATNPDSYYVPVDQSALRYDWQSESKTLRGAGWGLFGGGLALQGLGIGFALAGIINGPGIGMVIAGYGMLAIGGLSTMTGIVLLIVEAAKFNPYRRGEIAGLEFEWKPDMIVSPEFNGAGVSFRF